jgi:hypothetical protein
VIQRPRLTAVLALGLYACAAPPPAIDPRVAITPDLPIVAEAPNVTTSAGLMRVTLRLVNSTPQDLPVLAITDWTDREGQPISTIMSAPIRLTVPRFGDAVVDRIAPRDSAVIFHIRVEPDRAAI